MREPGHDHVSQDLPSDGGGTIEALLTISQQDRRCAASADLRSAQAAPATGHAILPGMMAMGWREQIAYYRARAAEYEVTSYRVVPGADRRIAAVVERLRPGGDLLEVACGTGMWTRHLAGCAARVTAIDAAPEMIALARRQVTAGNVTFVIADIMAWAPPRRFDTIFFAFWLSHVPASQFGRFWALLRGALASGGRVQFVDDQPAAAALETYVEGSGEVVERRLRDGTRHQLIKVIRHPADLTRQLTRLGWQVTITSSGEWLVSEARQRRRSGPQPYRVHAVGPAQRRVPSSAIGMLSM